MRLEDLVLRIPGDEFQVRFHEHLTVLSGIGMLERQALADSLVGALSGQAENTILTYRDRTGRQVEIVSSGGTAACRFVDDDSPALPLLGTVAPTADALRALVLLQAGDLGLTPSRARSDDHPELAEARATLLALTKEIEAATAGRSQRDNVRDELTAITAQIRLAEDGTARREYAGVLADLERVRAESAALQSGSSGAETDQHLLDSAEETRELAARWQAAAARVTRLMVHAPAERLDPVKLAEVRWYPDNAPSNLHALLDELADARRERDRFETRLRDLATSKLPEPSDPRIIDLATANQAELWQAAADVTETSQALASEQVALGGMSSASPDAQGVDVSTLDVIARIEETHRVVEDLEALTDQRRVPAIAGAALLAVTSLIFAPSAPLVALGLLAAACVGAFVGIGRPMRQLVAARKQEAAALVQAGTPSYLVFHIRRVEASMSPGAHQRLDVVGEAHRVAMAKWREMAGLVSVDGARQIESEVRAYANALAQLGNTAGELDSLRHELSDRIEPAVLRARTSLIEACATYGLDDVTVETADAAHLERLVFERVELGRIARQQEELEESEADEEKLANRLDDLLHQLGFRDGTLDARAGALDWAVERAAERQHARLRARPRAEIEEDLTRLQNEARRLRRPEWASVQAADAEGPDLDELVARQAQLRSQLENEGGREVAIDLDRLVDRHSAMERRVASLEAQIDNEIPGTTIAQVADYLRANARPRD